MPRQEKNSVDYFPFYCKEGKAMYIIENTYGNDGFAVWVKILRQLAVTNYHYLDLSEDADRMFLSAKCRVPEDTLLNIINDLVKLGEFDSKMWNEHQIIWSEKFIEGVQEAYRKRSNECISYEGLLRNIQGKGRNNEVLFQRSGGRSTQIKEKKIKEDKIKEKETKVMSESDASDASPKNQNFFNIGSAFYQLFKKNSDDLNVTWVHLEKVTVDKFLDPIRLMVERDKRTMDDLRLVWKFLQTDDFWKPNIQSSEKLREKFDKLITQAKNGNRSSKKYNTDLRLDEATKEWLTA